MKHSIKREQSHARMSFAEFENQRSLAEGESNVRATLKHMKLSFSLILTLTLAVMLTMAQTAMAAITGSGTADDPYLISSTEDWNTFANNVNNGTSYSGQTVKLNADISVTTMVGTYDNPFNGTFDGGGHTLSVTLNNDSQYGDDNDAYYGVAPFRFTNGATIQFLVVTGIVTTSTRKYAAGLIGMTKGGTNTVLNCISSVEIYSTINNKWGDNDGTHGGFIGKASGTVIINNCLFNGQLTTTSDNPTINCGGFVGWRDGTLSISNSLYAPNTTIPSGKTAVNVGATFSRNDVTPTNSYYTQTLGTAQGTAVGSKTATQLVAALGSAWRVSGGRAVPKLLLSTKSFTIANAAGADYCGTITYDGNDFLVPDADMMQNQLFEGKITMRSKMTGDEGTVKLYPRMSGKVKSLTFSSARVTFSDVVGTEHYVKIGRGNIWTNSYTEDMNKATALTFTFTNDDGLQLANEDDYLEIKMRNSESTRNASLQNIEGKITITYEPTEATETHRHNFTYNVEGNTLTATCAHDDGKECNLASSSYQISTSLMPPQNLIFTDGWNYPASMSGFENFRSETKATIGSFTYIKTDTNEDYGTSKPNAMGTYSASVTINADNYPYTLTTSYRVTDFNFIHINYPQFTTDKAENNYVGDGETVTLTFTPKFGETLTGLTVTGVTTNMSIGSGITSIGNNKYTFTMPAEDVTISATFSAPDASHFEQTGENEYTIKTANGWGWFCFATNYDLAPEGFGGKTVKLGTSVGSSEMAGTSGHPFKGTFDGQGNTLTFNRTAAEDFCAPFHYINGATISNLHVEGTITGGTYESLGGLVGRAEGNITINNCRVSSEISTTVSDGALHGGVIADWNGTNATCTVTGCVYDGLIYNPDVAGVTTSCHGFIGWDYGNNMTIKFTDCLSAPAAYGTDKYALGGNCFTFVYPNSEPTYIMRNCYYTSILGNRQGRPAATTTVAPANLGNAMTDHGMVDGYENGFLYDGNYYTPKYGDAVVEYRFNDWNERADVTINGTGENLVGVNITEEVGNIKSVTYNRPFSSGKAAMVILPFNYTCNDSEGSEGGKFYSFAGISVMAPIVEDGNHVTSLTANTPYLFVPTATTMTFPNITNMTGGVVTLQPTTGDHKVTLDGGNWTLVGSYSIKTWVTEDLEIDKAYFINDEGELEKIVSGMITAPTECYLLRNFEIVTPTVTAPTAIAGLVYTGEAQALVSAGTTNYGTLLYSTDGENYSAAIPTGTDAGTYTIYYKVEENVNWNAVDAQSVEVTIAPKPITVSGITAVWKTYDGTTDATLDNSAATISGLVSGDNLTVTATGTFADANAGEGKEVAISGITLVGTDAANYVLAESGQQASATASITKATPEAGDFVFSAPTDLSYDGSVKAATISLVGTKTGVGSITISYYKDGVKVDAPVAAGTYTVKIDVAEGDNFAATTTALEDDSWTFTITGPAEGAPINIALTEEYGTYCSDYDLDFSGATGLTAYIAAGYNKTEHTLLMVKVTSVPKGTGLLLKGTAGSTYTAKVQTSPYVYSNLLTGTTAETNVTADDFILGKKGDKVGFYHAEEGTLAAGKAYLDHTKLGTSTSGAPMLNLEFYDDATGIADVRSKMSDAVTEDWYTLDGRKLQGRPTKKGLYLLNGKKVVVR